MTAQLYSIKSLAVQNAIMLFSLGIVAALLVRAILRRNSKGVIVFGIWVLVVVGFFNSPFFGFSAVTVSSQGIGLEYGILSLRNTTLPLSSPWEIKTHLGGIRKTKRLYAIRIGNRESMQVKGAEGQEVLRRIGEAIDRTRIPSSGWLTLSA